MATTSYAFSQMFSTPPMWRQRDKTPQLEEPPTGAQETPRGEMEVEKEPAPEEAMEE